MSDDDKTFSANHMCNQSWGNLSASACISTLKAKHISCCQHLRNAINSEVHSLLCARSARNKRYYQKRKQQLKKQSDQQIEKHLTENPYDLNFGMKPVRDSFPNFKEWREANPNGSWKEYSELLEILKEDQPRPLDPSHLSVWTKPLDGCCVKCGREIEVGYEGAKLCLNCRLEMS